jgi:hypothetical protein
MTTMALASIITITTMMIFIVNDMKWLKTVGLNSPIT